jgi:hypothetical protein
LSARRFGEKEYFRLLEIPVQLAQHGGTLLQIGTFPAILRFGAKFVKFFVYFVMHFASNYVK